MDLKMTMVFYNNGDYKFMAGNFVAVYVGLIYTYAQMYAAAQEIDGPGDRGMYRQNLMLAIGVLIPVAGHYSVLCIYEGDIQEQLAVQEHHVPPAESGRCFGCC